MKHALILLAAGLVMNLSTAALAQEPIDALREPIEEVIDILKDPKYADGADVEEQRERLWAIIEKIFDFEAIARGTLKRHRWKSFTPDQRKEFTDAFTRFLGNNYFNQVRGKYRNEQVVFIDQRMKTKSKALVRTKIVREAVEIPVDYSMWQRKGSWRIYNVRIEGASLLGNYRNEFERFLQKDSPDDLIDVLRKKVEIQQKGSIGS